MPANELIYGIYKYNIVLFSSALLSNPCHEVDAPRHLMPWLAKPELFDAANPSYRSNVAIYMPREIPTYSVLSVVNAN